MNPLLLMSKDVEIRTTEEARERRTPPPPVSYFDYYKEKKEKEAKASLPFIPRHYQRKLIDAVMYDYDRAVICWHRRCLSGESHIMMANGAWKKLRDINVGDKILSWNGKKLEPDFVEDIWNTGNKECIQASVYGARDLAMRS